MWEIILFAFIYLVAHTYFVYPFSIYILALLKTKPKLPEYSPKITILIAAYNEEKVIERRIRNLALQNYDHSKIEVLVGSDNSSDSTNLILKRLQSEFDWLKIFIYNERSGKAGVLNRLFENVNNEIVLFTDANTDFDKSCIKNLVKYFSDSGVGGVSGRLVLEDKLIDKKEGIEEKSYWEYETFIKRSEGKYGALIGANGGVFAIRKKYLLKIPTQKAVTDDFFLSLNVLNNNKKFVYADDAVGRESVAKTIKQEFKRKVRFAATNFQSMLFFPRLLFNKRFIVSYAFWSHKIIRWFIPHILLVILVLSFLLMEESEIVKIIFFGQIIFYMFALIGLFLNLLKIRLRIFSLPYFFIISNIALAIGFVKFLFKKHSVVWETTER